MDPSLVVGAIFSELGYQESHVVATQALGGVLDGQPWHCPCRCTSAIHPDSPLLFVLGAVFDFGLAHGWDDC